MLTLPAALQAHIAQDVTTLAVCWRVTRTDGVLILGTEHDRDITIGTGAYAGLYVANAGITGSNVRSTSDMSVDNMEVDGAINSGDLSLVDLSVADIEAGLFDDAAVALFLVNWDSPDDGQIVLRTGNIGEIRRTSEGQYTTELRGLAQRLSQNIVRTYGSSCDAELGDTRCGVNLATITVTGTVTAVTSNRKFTALLAGVEPLEVDLYLPMPRDIQVGDTFTIRPGCDKSAPACKVTFNNYVNFRGHGFLVPGVGEMGVFGGQTAEKTFTGSLLERTIDQYFANHPWPTGVGGSPTTPYYNGGLVTWTSGDNDTFSMEVKLGLPPA